MQVLRILAAVALAIGLVSAADTPIETRRLAGGNASCGAARVRKPWDSLTKKEQSLYIEALGRAIESGVVKDLSAMHLESMGETQAHHSCAFFAWHRRMLLAFESYMRDLDPKFACLTIPYYDVHAAYVNAANKKCTNMFDCSPIFQALGGAPAAFGQARLTYNGETTGGFPVKGAPFTKDCDDNKTLCGAMLRNNLEKKSVPSGAGFGTFLAIVTRSPDYASFLEGIQFGLHNEIHNAVGGTMATLASPRDVFFYSWHGAIDMYLSAFHQCHVGTGFSATQSRQAFTLATQTCGGVSGVGADSKMLMRFKVNGKLVDATQHPLLGKYFAKLGDTMANFADTTSLGDYSYSYEFPAIIKTQVLSNKDICKGVNANATPAPTTPKPTTPAPTTPKPTTPKPTTPKPTTTAPMTGNGTVGLPSLSSTSGSGSGVDDKNDDANNTVTLPTTPPTTVPAPTTLPTNHTTVAPHSGIVVVKDTDAPTKAPAYGQQAYGDESKSDDSDESDETEVGDDDSADGAYGAYGASKNSTNNNSTSDNGKAGKATGSAKATKVVEATTGAYWEWVKTTYDGLVARFDGDMKVVTEQMRVIECMAFDKVFGVTEFSEDFVKNFHLASSQPVCGKKIDAVASGNVTVAIATAAVAFKPEEVTFAAPAVIEVVKQEAIKEAATPTTEAPQINAAFIKTAEKTLQDAAAGKMTEGRAANGNDPIPSDATKLLQGGAAAPQVNAPVVANAGDKTLGKETATSPMEVRSGSPNDAGKKKKKHRLCH